jgi:hypothetical protein
MQYNIGWAGEIFDVERMTFRLRPNSKYEYVDMYIYNTLADGRPINIHFSEVKVSTDDNCKITIESYNDVCVEDNNEYNKET